MRELEAPFRQLCPMVHNPMVVVANCNFAILCFPSGSTAPTEFTRSSEVTVLLHIPESSVKRQASSPASYYRQPQTSAGLPASADRGRTKQLPGHSMTVGSLHLPSPNHCATLCTVRQHTAHYTLHRCCFRSACCRDWDCTMR